jgi:rod shape-determining protein MreC
MRRLEPDLFSRGTAGQPARRRPSFVALALLLVSVALLILSRADNAMLARARWQLAQLLAPVMAAAVVPLEPVRWTARQIAERRDLLEENARLRHENERLAGFELRARELERRMTALGTLARVVEESAIPFATARVIAEASGPFVRAVIVDAGREHGLKPGHPVIGAHGLIGRVIETGPQTSRILLLTDRTSRIPSLIGNRETRGIVAGDNAAELKLQFTAASGEIAVGDEVVTSGVGGLFPRGLLIGRVVADGTGFRVQPHVRLDRLDYVSALLVSLPGIDVADEARTPPMEARSRRAQARPGEENR